MKILGGFSPFTRVIVCTLVAVSMASCNFSDFTNVTQKNLTAQQSANSTLSNVGLGSSPSAMQAFQSGVYAIARRDCQSCHGASQTPLFAAANLAQAYNQAVNYVNFSNVSTSLLVQQSMNGHCGLSVCTTSGTEMIQAIQSWANAINAAAQNPAPNPPSIPSSIPTPSSVPTPTVTPSPTATATPAPTPSPVPSPTSSLPPAVQAFQSSVYVIGQRDCKSCHAGTQAPFWVSPNITQAYNEAKPYADFSNPAASILVFRTTNGHCGTACMTNGSEMTQAIQVWAAAELAANPSPSPTPTPTPSPSSSPSATPIASPSPSPTPSPSASPPSPQALFQPGAFGQGGIRRLTDFEITASLKDIFGVDPTPYEDALPADQFAQLYFDNEAAAQDVSQGLILDYDQFANQYAAAVAKTSGIVSKLAGCTPASVSDQTCFVKFVDEVGRRMFHRPVTSAEETTYSNALLPYAQTDNNFNSAIELFVRALMEHPEFLYRIEVGTPSATNPGLMELNQYEIAARMSFLIWGTVPDDTLLNAAAANQLSTQSERLSQAKRMLADPKAIAQWNRYHSEWIGYGAVALPPNLDADMRNETAMLVKHIVFDLNTNWMDLFNYNQTYVTPALAANYGFSGVSSPGWVTYPNNPAFGGGFLSHAAFEAIGSKFGDTSPTLRGAEIYRRFECGILGSSPPGVDPTMQPGSPTDCKTVRYYMRNDPNCEGCHGITDNIGFGLENLGPTASWRTNEPVNTQCVIDGSGSINSTPFVGPKQLGALLAGMPQVQECAVRQLFRFTTGRLDTFMDQGTINAMYGQYLQTPSLQSLIETLVETPAITFK